MYTMLLDARFSLKSCHWRDEAEKSHGKKLLLVNVEDYAVKQASAASNPASEEYCSSLNKDSDDVMLFGCLKVKNKLPPRRECKSTPIKKSCHTW